jgi:hypothetical protein
MRDATRSRCAELSESGEQEDGLGVADVTGRSRGRALGDSWVRVEAELSRLTPLLPNGLAAPVLPPVNRARGVTGVVAAPVRSSKGEATPVGVVNGFTMGWSRCKALAEVGLGAVGKVESDGGNKLLFWKKEDTPPPAAGGWLGWN